VYNNSFFLTVLPNFATTEIFLMFYVHEFKVNSKVWKLRAWIKGK